MNLSLSKICTSNVVQPRISISVVILRGHLSHFLVVVYWGQ